MTEKTTIERVRHWVHQVGAFDPEVGRWPGPKDDQPLFYAAMEMTDVEARASGNAGLDSLDQVELLMELEDEFEIKVPDDAQPGNTIAEITAWVDNQKGAE